MKTVIIYASVHHNNTKELVCAIAAENDIDVVAYNNSFRSYI